MRIFFLAIWISFSVTLHAQVYQIDLKDLDGFNVRLEDERGAKLTVIDFWASWCKPCLVSMPKLQNLSEKYEIDGVAFWGINVDSPRNQAKVKPLVKSLGLAYPIFRDTDQDLMNDLDVIVLPTLVITDVKGEVLFRHEGYQFGDDKLIDTTIGKLLEEHSQ